MKYTIITVGIKKDLLEEAKKIAKEEGTTLDDIANMALLFYLAKHENSTSTRLSK